MRFSLILSIVFGLAALSTLGCDTPDQPTDTPAPETGHPHSHEGGDALVWVEEGVEHEGFVLALGHHGEHLHEASKLEPAISITRDGAAVADAKVFNSLISADGNEVISEEVATIYEPETDDEPAHYAQGKLYIPKGSQQYIIRFRIELPGVDDELTKDVTIELDE